MRRTKQRVPKLTLGPERIKIRIGECINIHAAVPPHRLYRPRVRVTDIRRSASPAAWRDVYVGDLNPAGYECIRVFDDDTASFRLSSCYMGTWKASA